MSGASLPLLNVIIPQLVEKRFLEGELDAQIDRNSFASTKRRGYFLDPLLCHHCNESLCKQSIQGLNNQSFNSTFTDFSSTFVLLLDCRSINYIITFECLRVVEAKRSSIGIELKASKIHTYSSMSSKVFITNLCSPRGICSNLNLGSSTVAIGNIGFLLTCISYFNNFSFVDVYVCLSAFAWSLLIFVPVKSQRG